MKKGKLFPIEGTEENGKSPLAHRMKTAENEPPPRKATMSEEFQAKWYVCAFQLHCAGRPRMPVGSPRKALRSSRCRFLMAQRKALPPNY